MKKNDVKNSPQVWIIGSCDKKALCELSKHYLDAFLFNHYHQMNDENM